MTSYKFGDVVLIDFLQATGDKKRRFNFISKDKYGEIWYEVLSFVKKKLKDKYL